MADADDATSALIAQLLASDQAAASGGGGYGGGYGYGGYFSDDGFGGDSDHDDDFSSRKKRRQKKATSKRKRGSSKSRQSSKTKRVKPTEPASSSSSSSSDLPVGSLGPDGKKIRAKPRRWTAEEEEKFLEALELYGRDWHKCAEHLGTRDNKAISSHAQKHFIRLYRDDKPLPDKVRESGEGYTLSGKPLDPDSAAARAYWGKGNRRHQVKGVSSSSLGVATDAASTISSSPTPSVPPPASVSSSAESDKKENNEASGGPAVEQAKGKGKDEGMDVEGANGASKSALSVVVADASAAAAEVEKASGEVGDSSEGKATHSSNGSSSSSSNSSSSGSGNNGDSDIVATTTSSATATPSTDGTSEQPRARKLSARELNDMLLAKARSEGGVDLRRQKVDRTERPYRRAGSGSGGATQLTAEEKAARVEEAARRQRERDARAKKKAEEKAERERQKWERRRAKAAAATAAYGSDGRTEHARQRPRRKAAMRNAFSNAYDPTLGGGSGGGGGGGAGPFAMRSSIGGGIGGGALRFVSLRRYKGPPGCGSPESQPFRIVVRPSAVALAEIHAHMTKREVIGFLAGRWLPPTGPGVVPTIEIQAAFPGKSLVSGEESGTATEMDPVCEVQLRDQIKAAGMRVVGWYHSHPCFVPTPSACDMENQSNYQVFFQDNGGNGSSNSTSSTSNGDGDVACCAPGSASAAQGTGLYPFVGLIVSPYDLKLPVDGPVSRCRWFYSRSPRTTRTPMLMEVDYLWSAPLAKPAIKDKGEGKGKDEQQAGEEEEKEGGEEKEEKDQKKEEAEEHGEIHVGRVLTSVMQRVAPLLSMYADFLERVDFKETWRDITVSPSPPSSSTSSSTSVATTGEGVSSSGSSSGSGKENDQSSGSQSRNGIGEGEKGKEKKEKTAMMTPLPAVDIKKMTHVDKLRYSLTRRLYEGMSFADGATFNDDETDGAAGKAIKGRISAFADLLSKKILSTFHS